MAGTVKWPILALLEALSYSLETVRNISVLNLNLGSIGAAHIQLHLYLTEDRG
jgi:hypothetical protein